MPGFQDDLFVRDVSNKDKEFWTVGTYPSESFKQAKSFANDRKRSMQPRENGSEFTTIRRKIQAGDEGYVREQRDLEIDMLVSILAKQ